MRINLETAVSTANLGTLASVVNISDPSGYRSELYLDRTYALSVSNGHISFKSGANYKLDNQRELDDIVREMASYYQ